MNRPELKTILQNAYDRSQWISTLQFLTGKRDLLTVNLSPKAIEINTQEADRLVKSFHQIGTLKTSDGASLPIFEIILEDDIRIEYNRVGVNEFIKKYIVKDAVKGALTTFSYDENREKAEWRFSFISKNSASDFFAEAEAEETNPKKYTYIFGNKEEHRTAIERLYNLEQSRFRLEDFFEAFNVEPVSKKFFEEYKHLYREFSNFIATNSNYLSLFENSEIIDNKQKTEKAIKEVRNFVSRLLGRIVFLYFLQKKNWLGASSTEYKDGSITFLSDLFFNDVENQDDFYNKYLCPIFFEALNTSERKNDEFKLENGKTVCIPFLNGGLFEEEQEPKEHRTIKIPAFQFKMLFDFFNGFNFTVYENSPEEHTVAVDPEMLGHIFENLIDYNKDTGTFYTPKEIVQYMTQESLIEYLNTHLQKDRSEIENMVKSQNADHFEDVELSKINQLLDDIKICDPAIGSGAFPMGMLQEIFNLKALINFKLGFDVWSPATVKQNIIQNSIYGVDLDEGAVEIARLRFWLSLVVDEGMPKALPNLDYKIMQGNSLLESYKGIDLSGISSGNDLKIVEKMQTDLFGNLVDDQMKMTVGKSGLAEEIQKLIKKYFTAKAIDKRNIKNKIEAKIAEHIEYNIELRENQLYRQISELENVKTLKPIQKKALEQYQKDLETLEQTKVELKKEQQKDEKNYFLWHLFFGDVLSKGGFDIVIGNPPYIQIKWLKDKVQIENSKYKTFSKTGDVYCVFYELANILLKNRGNGMFITSNKWLRAEYGQSLRNYFVNQTNPLKLIDFKGYKVFETATVDTNILLWKNERYEKITETVGIEGDFNATITISDYFKANNKLISFENNNQWVVLSSNDLLIKEQIENGNKRLSVLNFDMNYGILTGANSVFIIGEKDYQILLNRDINNTQIIKPILRGKDVRRYGYKFNNYYLINSHTGIKEKNIQPINIPKDYPTIEDYFLSFGDKFKNRGEQGINWYNLRSCNYIDKFESPKIIYADIVQDRGKFYYDENNFYTNDTAFIISGNNIKPLTALLNSKLVSFAYKTFYSGGGLGDKGLRFKKEFLGKVPIPLSFTNFHFSFFVDLIQYLNDNKLEIDDEQNSQISNFFDEVIDGLVFDLYFKNEMKSKNICITDEVKVSLEKHNVGHDFQNLGESRKKEIILALYKEWSTGSVQIKMADYTTKSPNILKPILQS